MSDDKKTIRVPEAAFQEARTRKEDAGQTWAEYLTDENRGGVDAEDVAREVVSRLEGSKPLAEMEFEDWFEPDYAQTIAQHIVSDIDSEAIESGFATTTEERLDRVESAVGTVEERTGRIERTLDELGGSR